MPGATSITRTGVPTISRRSVSARTCSACLAATYPPPPSYVPWPAVEERTTTVPSPLAVSAGSRAWVTFRVPMTFVSYIWRHWAGSPVAIGSAPSAPPALFTSTPIVLNAVANSSTAARSVTSRAYAVAWPPAAEISSASASIRSLRRAVITTR